VSAVEVSVLIPTFRRPELLRAAIESVLAQEQLAVDAEIVVIDNDPAGSARGVVADIASTGAMELRYVCEPRPGISHARNTGVAASRGAYVAFLDDDEAASPLWLASFLATMQAHLGDVVVGPVRPRFPDGVPVSAYARRIYERDALTSTGQAIEWSGIGNSLLRRDRCLAAQAAADRIGIGDDCLGDCRAAALAEDLDPLVTVRARQEGHVLDHADNALMKLVG